MIEYAEIESGIIGLVEPMRQTHGVKTIESYGGEFNESEIVNNGGVVLVYPAVLINVSGFVETSISDREYDVTIYCCDLNARGDIGARSGVYALLRGVRDLVRHGRIPGSTAIKLTSEKKEFYSKNLKLCLYSANYKLKAR